MFRNAKVGQEMSVWVQDRHVAIDLYQDGVHSIPPLSLRPVDLCTGRADPH